MKKFFNKLLEKTKWLRSATVTIILILVIVAIYIGINMFVESQEIADIDLTQEQLYSLSEESKTKLASVEQDTRIIFFGMSDYTDLIDFAKRYEKENSHIQYIELAEATERPDLQIEYGLGTSVEQLIIIETDSRKKALTTSDLTSYNYDTYEQVDISEQSITNAILDVNLEKNPKLYIVTNHAMYTGYFSIATEYLTNEANEVENLDLLVTGLVPTDCDVLVLTTPKEDFTEFEIDLIMAYINDGGNVMMLIDPNTNKTDLSNFQKILDLYGVSVAEGVVYEGDDSRAISGYANIIIPEISYSSEITKYIATDGALAMINTGKIDFKSDEELEELGITKESIVTTTSTSYIRKDVTQTSSTRNEYDEDAIGETLAAVVTKQKTSEDGETKTSELVIVANSIFASDWAVRLYGSSSNTATQIYGIMFYNNKDLLINSISYLTQRKDNISLRKDTGLVTYTATEFENKVIEAIIIAIPIITILVGIIVWQVRRRKK